MQIFIPSFIPSIGSIAYILPFPIAQFRYFKIQLETKDITTRLRGVNHINLLYYSPKPRSDVIHFKLNFNISKLGYCDR